MHAHPMVRLFKREGGLLGGVSVPAGAAVKGYQTASGEPDSDWRAHLVS